MNLAAKEALESDPEKAKKKSEKLSENLRRQYKEGKRKRVLYPHKPGMFKHSKKFKERIGKINSQHQQGSKNSQYGTCWIHLPQKRTNKKIPNHELQIYLDLGWVKGRKIKFE